MRHFFFLYFSCDEQIFSSNHLQPNGTKSKKPSAQRENKNTESNAAQNTLVEASNEHNIKSNQTSAVTQHQTINRPATSQPIQTQSTAVHQVSHLLNRKQKFPTANG